MYVKVLAVKEKAQTLILFLPSKCAIDKHDFSGRIMFVKHYGKKNRFFESSCSCHSNIWTLHFDCGKFREDKLIFIPSFGSTH